MISPIHGRICILWISRRAYRVADVDENDVYTATKQFDELAKSISDVSSKTTADDWEKMAKTAADIADKGFFDSR